MKKIIIAISIFLCFANSVSAAFVGDVHSFYVDSEYDATNRTSLDAVLIKSSSKLNIYVDTAWWNFTSQEGIQSVINLLSEEFDNKIYPSLVSAYGQEWTPGIDNDSKITILIHPMNSDAGGYFREADEYEKLQLPDSNQREMIYINSKYILDANLKSFVAHEFTHLITFNQKNKKYGAEDDTWLNEARAEYSSTLLGYNNNYSGSYLERRVQYFSEKPTGSLIDWQNTKYDYGRVSLFVHYLVDQYGINILTDSMHSKKIGIDSINDALQKNGFKDDFSKIFANWTIAVLINDCNYGIRYCYLDKNLKNFYLSPQINFLPLTGNTTLTMSDNTKTWSVNWYKIIGGGNGTMKFYFEGDSKVIFKVIYILKNQSGEYVLKLLAVDKSDNGGFNINNFGKDTISLFVIPFLEGGLTPDNYFHSFLWSASIVRQDNNTDEINKLLAIIDSLKKQIAAILAERGQTLVEQKCSAITNNLSMGMNGDSVKCLQEFLKNQGQEIYPEGYVTGIFGSLTKKAVIKFQEKYGIPNTGYVGSLTREKINNILNGS